MRSLTSLHATCPEYVLNRVICRNFQFYSCASAIVTARSFSKISGGSRSGGTACMAFYRTDEG